MSSRLIIPSLAALCLVACGGGSPESDTTASQTAGAPTESTSSPAPAEAEPAATAPATTAENTPATAEAEASDGPDPAVILAGLGGDYTNADLTNGARQYRRCQSCHTLNEGGRHTVGPNLFGVIDSPAAARPRFRYSRQLTDANLTWDAATLDAWLANPRALVPGNRMSFAGLRNAPDRRDVIAFIAVETAE